MSGVGSLLTWLEHQTAEVDEDLALPPDAAWDEAQAALEGLGPASAGR